MLGFVTNNTAPIGPRGVDAPAVEASVPGIPAARSFLSFLQAPSEDDVANEGEAPAHPEDTVSQKELDDHDENIGAIDEDLSEGDAEDDSWDVDSYDDVAPMISGGEAEKVLSALNPNVEFGPPLDTEPGATDASLARSAGEQTNAYGIGSDAALNATKHPDESAGLRAGNLQGAIPSGPAAPSGIKADSASAHDARKTQAHDGSLQPLKSEDESHLKAPQGASLPLPLRETSPGAVLRRDVPSSWLAAKSAWPHPVEVAGAPEDVGLAEAASSSSVNGAASTVRAVAEIAMPALSALDGFRLHSDGGGHAALTPEMRIATSFAAEPRTSMTPPSSSPETARHIAAQVIEAMGKNSERAIDVILNPAELGRVRITLSHGDAGMVVNVAAERAETLDLMRRHSDLLGQEFADLGYGATEFSFSRENGGSDLHAPPSEVSVMPPDLSPDQRPAITGAQSSSVVMVDRLDIRL